MKSTDKMVECYSYFQDILLMESEDKKIILPWYWWVKIHLYYSQIQHIGGSALNENNTNRSHEIEKPTLDVYSFRYS